MMLDHRLQPDLECYTGVLSLPHLALHAVR